MKKMILLAVAALMMSAASHTEIRYKDLEWITGNWHMDAGEIQVYESWKKGKDESYVGEAWVLQGRDTIVTEYIKIEKIGPHWVYIAQINDGNPVLFTLKETSEPKNLVFENMEHDNPKWITYKWINKNEVLAATETDIEGPITREEYPYKRR